MEVKAFFDKDTSTLTYIVFDPKTKDAIIIDPVLDYSPAAGRVEYTAVKDVVDFVNRQSLSVHYILETHAHADHLSGSQPLKKIFPKATLAIGERITEVQKIFKNVFNLRKNFKTDGSQFDRLLKEGEIVEAGSIRFKVLFTPGHTPACASYLVNDEAVFTGDALFMPDFGTGRCDFPGGDAETLYNSVTKNLYTLPDKTKLYVGHDYQPGGRELEFQSTVGIEKSENKHIKANTTKEEFVKFRTERDKELDAPTLLFPSVQVNIDAGHLPAPEDNGTSYIKIPLTVKEA